MDAKSVDLQIQTTWNNVSIPKSHRVNVQLYLDRDLTIRFASKFYNDPKLPANTPIGIMDDLFNYEVVEVFLLGKDEQYLEVELGPFGQYLVLQLKGYRNVVKSKIKIDQVTCRIEDNHWNGTIVIPKSLLPPDITHLNAYAIYGSGDKRTYLALYPAPENNANYTKPDFHRLELFQPTDLFKK